MKRLLPILAVAVAAIACDREQTGQSATAPAIVGTWQLVRATLIEKGDTAVTDYTKNVSFIKIINDTHFAFLKHSLTKEADSTEAFTAGGGRYELANNQYTEHLAYCNDRQWEGHDFTFTLTMKGDTLIQRGVEKIEAAGIDRLNTEEYVRVKP